ncbi:hypothetical protein PCANC_27330 [Puccinia coronata f. sp. avenae]|uniref:Retrotransposon gag domain-containing protein n=1 Tax=Puccinia coronata f. sp. avenae TaxID=200324 RepID=A0A2N5S802_9BASI|nr:hypothetical protein PCANC_27330 [Puccinia coronata f. sp. avenae]
MGTPPGTSREAREETGDATEGLSTNNYLRLLMSAQHASIVQAQVKREASAARIARLEETLIALSLKTKAPPAPLRPKTNRIDLQLFKTLDGPSFNGPFQAIKPFLKWIHGLQIFFATKDVRHNADKIHIAGSLIWETNTLAFYASLVDNLVLGSWDDFKKAMFDFALPPLWRTTLHQKIDELPYTKKSMNCVSRTPRLSLSTATKLARFKAWSKLWCSIPASMPKRRNPEEYTIHQHHAINNKEDSHQQQAGNMDDGSSTRSGHKGKKGKKDQEEERPRP